METLSIRCDSSLFDKLGEYSLSEKQLEVFTGLNWEQLKGLKEMLLSLRNSQSRSVIKALIVFLLKLRKGKSNKMLSSILQLKMNMMYLMILPVWWNLLKMTFFHIVAA